MAERESVNPPLKDKVFSTFLNQNPPFELRPENGVSPPTKACNAVFRDWWRRRLPPKAKATRSNRVGCAIYARARYRDLQAAFPRCLVTKFERCERGFRKKDRDERAKGLQMPVEKYDAENWCVVKLLNPTHRQAGI